MLDYRDYPELSAEFVAAHPMDDPRFEPWLEATYGSLNVDPGVANVADLKDPTGTLFIARSWMLGATLTERFGIESVGETLWRQNGDGDIDWYAPMSNGGRILWDAAYDLYTNIFEPNADHTLGHLSEGCGLFQSVVYMFWETDAWHPGTMSATARQRSDFLRICERALASPKASVQESALHGLGHATRDMPEAKRAIERFLAKGKPRRRELRPHAEAALTGGID